MVKVLDKIVDKDQTLIIVEVPSSLISERFPDTFRAGRIETINGLSGSENLFSFREYVQEGEKFRLFGGSYMNLWDLEVNYSKEIYNALLEDAKERGIEIIN
jgi:hypothetical protein